MVISNRSYDREQSTVTLGNDVIQIKNNCKFLGVFLDDKLNFTEHIRHVLNKLSRSAGILYRIRDSLPIAARMNFYYAFIYPYLTYNVTIWGGTNATHIRPIITQQKRIIRTICNSQKFDSTSILFYQLKILKFVDIYRFNMCTYMHTSISEGKYRIIHDLNTRNSTNNLASSKYHRLTTCQQAVSYRGPQIWNSLPAYLRDIKSLSLFKNKLRSYFINQYQ